MIWAYITLITIISSEREADASRENYRELEKGRERESKFNFKFCNSRVIISNCIKTHVPKHEINFISICIQSVKINYIQLEFSLYQLKTSAKHYTA